MTLYLRDTTGGDIEASFKALHPEKTAEIKSRHKQLPVWYRNNDEELIEMRKKL